jgi:hypothetical protein
MKNNKTTPEKEGLSWLPKEKLTELFKEHAKLDVLEVESIKNKGTLYECVICPPSEVAWSMSSRELSNQKEGANDILRSQAVIAEHCIVAAEPGLQEELDDEATATPVKVSIGTAIGKMYPARLLS